MVISSYRNVEIVILMWFVIRVLGTDQGNLGYGGQYICNIKYGFYKVYVILCMRKIVCIM